MLSLSKDLPKTLKYSLLLALLFASLQIFSFGSFCSADVEGAKEAPDFTLKDLEGKDFALSAPKGKGIIHIIFTAVWCVPCKGEMAKLNDTYERLQLEGYTIIAIGVPTRQTPERLKEFVQKEKIKFPVLYDTSGKVVESYRAQFLPKSVIIDKSGAIRYEWDFIPDNFNEIVAKLLKE